MNEDQLEPGFEQELRSMLRRRSPSEPPVALRSFVWAVPQREPNARRRSPLVFRFAAFAGTAAVIVLAVAALAILAGNRAPGPIGAPTSSARTNSPAPTARVTMKFTIDPGDQVPTAAELQTTAEVLFTRLAVYLPSTTRDDVSVATDGSGAVSVALELPSPEDMIAARANVDLIARLQYVLKARGYIEFVGLDSLDLQPPPTIEPGAALFAGDSVESVTPGLNEAGQQALDIRLKAPAARALAEWSSAHVGSVLAIAIDGRVYFAPVIQAPLTDGELTLVLAGTESVDPLRLEALLRSGPLPYRLQLSLPPEPSPSP